MTNALLASKTIIEEEAPRIQNIQGVATSTLGCVGVTKWGPFGATLITSFEQYLTMFGGYTPNGYTTNAMEGFFRNGGQTVYIVRVVHYADPTDPSTKTSAPATGDLPTASAAPSAGRTQGSAGPWSLADGQTIVVAFEAGGNQTFTIHGAAASRTSSAGPFNVTTGDGYNLTIGGVSAAWAIQAGEVASPGAAAPAEIKNSFNAFLAGHGMPALASVSGSDVVVATNQKGLGASIDFVSAIVNGGNLGFTTGALAGTGNVPNLAAVVPGDLTTILSGLLNGTYSTPGGLPTFTSATTGGGSTAQYVGSSTANLGFDTAVHDGGSGAPVNTLLVSAKWDGAYGNTITITTGPATSGDADAFNLTVLLSGVVVEVWSNLLLGTANAADPQYVETIINDVNKGSAYISVDDLLAAVASPGNLPAVATSPALTGGSDGLSGIVDSDYVGAATENGQTGIRVLDTVQDLSLLIVPGGATPAIHNAMLAYVETQRNGQAFAVLDPPFNQSTSQVITYFTQTADVVELSEYGAAYWPNILVLNPDTTTYGQTAANITVPPSGHITGVMARNDANEGGVYVPPGGTVNGQLTGCVGFEMPEVLQEANRDLLYPKRINPLDVLPGQPRCIDGVRTLKSTGNFPTVGERRGAIFIEQSIKLGLTFARLQNNTEELRAMCERTCQLFLIQQTAVGAFRSKDPSTAFFVDFGDALNSPAVQFAGKLIGRIGIASVKPAEFIILRFSQDTRALDEQVATATAQT